MAAELTRRKRRLGRYMEAIRKSRDSPLKPEEVAERTETSRPTITRMEGGSQLPNKHLFVAILNVLGVDEKERREALALWQSAKQGTISVEHAADLPPKYIAFRRDESEASAEWTINYVAIPGLLQTSAYASAIADGNHALGRRDAGWVRRAAEERQARQRLLVKEPPLRLHALVSEAVLQFAVGGREVLIEQLEHLVRAAAKANITIQVVPFSAGSFGAMNGPVIIFSFDDDPAAPHSVYLEHPAGGETLEKEADVASFVALFDDVRALALPGDESVALIRAVLDKIKDEQ